jgi:carbon-monoxide dehydrogenase large subunit
LRRKNFITEFPHQTPVIMTYDAGDFDGNLDKAHGRPPMWRFPGPQGRGRGARQAARHRLFAYIEACGIAPSAAVGIAGRRVSACGNRPRCG